MVHESHDWMCSIYGDIEKVLPSDIPTPLGKLVLTSSFFNANLYHNLVTGHTMTGILLLVNLTPIEWYCKKQATVATAMYSSEFIAIQSMTDQVIDLWYTLCMMGVPLDYHSYTFGDNHAIIQQTNIPASKLMKSWNALAFHHV